MIIADLHKQPAVLDRVEHRALRLKRDQAPLTAAQALNAVFLTAAEFGDACREYPIFFLRAGNGASGKPQVAPVAVLGMQPGENLFLQKTADGGTRWDARYVPAMLRAYPFTMAQVQPDQWAVCFDRGWAGFATEGDGEMLFDEKGEPTPFLAGMRGFVETLEAEIERTRQGCERLLELGLLQDKRFDATLPDGSPLAVEGFMAVDEKRVAELSDAEVLELHRKGLLGLLVTHQVSLGNMRHLVERRLAIGAGAPAA